MNKKPKKKGVHIVPMGYEIERIIEPLINYDAKKVYLITSSKTGGPNVEFREILKKEIPKKVGEKVELEIIKTGIWDQDLFIGIFNKLIEKEQKEGNEVYINISSGNKLSAIAGTIAAFMHKGVIPYYAKAEKYNGKIPEEGLTSGVEKIIELPLLPIDHPEYRLIKTLMIIEQKRKEYKQEWIRQSTIIKNLEKMKLLESAKKSKYPKNSRANRFYRWYLKKLLGKKWVEKTGKRRGAIITTTSLGRRICEMFEPEIID